MAEFLWRAFQNQTETFTNVLSSSAFTGSEVLTCSIYLGDTETALLTVTPIWDTGPEQTDPVTLIDTTLNGTNLAAFAPGSYSVLIGLLSGGAALQKGLLTIYPAPGGTPPLFERALATPSLAQDILPDLTQDQIDWLPFALRAATRACETYVGRPLVLTAFDQIIRPNNSIRLRLKTRPIVEVSRVACQVVSGAQVSNTTAGATAATMQSVIAFPGSLQITKLIFGTVAYGVVTGPQTLVLASIPALEGGLPTFGDLCTAIDDLGNGWSAFSEGVSSSPYADIALTEAFGSPGTQSCLMNEYPPINAMAYPLGWFWDDPYQGFIELNEPIPGGYIIPNPRVERADTRYWGVRVTYRAGYAVTQADIALGYQTVPENVAMAACFTAMAIIEAAPMMGPVATQAVKDRSYTLKEVHEIVPQAAKELLEGEMGAAASFVI